MPRPCKKQHGPHGRPDIGDRPSISNGSGEEGTTNAARMTRSLVLLHCPNARLAAARMEAWDPGGVRVLLSNPRWESRLLRFLELSEVGRVMEVQKKPRPQEWTNGLYGRQRKGLCREMITSFFCSYFLSILCKEDSYSETCAQRNAEGGGSLLSGLACSRFLLSAVCILLWSERQKREQNK
jgi:hypothetical protein